MADIKNIDINPDGTFSVGDKKGSVTIGADSVALTKTIRSGLDLTLAVYEKSKVNQSEVFGVALTVSINTGDSIVLKTVEIGSTEAFFELGWDGLDLDLNPGIEHTGLNKRIFEEFLPEAYEKVSDLFQEAYENIADIKNVLNSNPELNYPDWLTSSDSPLNEFDPSNWIEGTNESDFLEGTNGDDVLEGGEGFDTYLADDGDFINDSDQQGNIEFNGEDLTGKKILNPETGHYEDSNFTYKEENGIAA